MIALGFSIGLALSFAVVITANVTDYILTKTALKLGLKEKNLVYNLIKRKISIDTFLAVGVLTWYVLMTALLITFRDATVLLFYSMGSFFCVVANAITLWSIIGNIIDNNNVTKP